MCSSTCDEFPASLRALVADRYGLDGTADQIVGGGDECLLWRLASTPPVVVRVSPAWRTAAELAATHRVAAALGATVLEATQPLAARVDIWDGRPVTVWPWIDGVPLDRDDSAQRKRAAELLARLHHAAIPVKATVAPVKVGDRIEPRRDSQLPDDALDAWRDQWLRDGAATEPTGLVHGDFYRRNILCRAGRIVGLVDWDDARHDLLVTELAWATWELAKSGDGTRLLVDRAQEFLNTYAAADGPVRPSAALIPLIRLQLRYEVDRAVRAWARGELIDRSYQRSEIEAFDALRHTPELGSANDN